MIVYGDAVRRLAPAAELKRLAGRLAAVGAAPAGLRRHAALTAVFVDAAALAQALLDAEFATLGADGDTPLHAAAMAWLLALAHAVDASWRGAGRAPSGATITAPVGLVTAATPARVDARVAEGFAHYALYPEGHAAAARAAGLDSEARVLGLRSIGAGLAAMAAAAGAPAPATARPVGHPFDRALSLDDGLRARIAADAARIWAVADEGPGLSGSSFGAAMAALEAAGVKPERIVLLPGHLGLLGGVAGPERRARYAAARRVCVGLEGWAGAASPLPLANWAQDLAGPAVAPLEDVGGGAWRAHLVADPADWPPADPARERRKLRLTTAQGRFRLKFAGLGAVGEARGAGAQALHAAGLGPPALGLRHGWLVEPWLEGARPLARTPVDLAQAAARVGDHLAFRARAFPAEPWEGADLATLWAMARANAAEALGEPAAAGLNPWRGRLTDLAQGSHRVAVDGRLHIWEWLRLPDGRVLKTDAVDHDRAHDLIGCQDIAWDVAGAAVELELDGPALADLARRLGVPRPRLNFYQLAYLAFQLGTWTQARDGQHGEEAARTGRHCDRYAVRLMQALQADSAG